MKRRETKREEQRAQSNREELLERIAQALPEDGACEALDGLFLARLTKPTESPLAVYQPAFCFVAQGGKQVLVRHFDEPFAVPEAGSGYRRRDA